MCMTMMHKFTAGDGATGLATEAVDSAAAVEAARVGNTQFTTGDGIAGLALAAAGYRISGFHDNLILRLSGAFVGHKGIGI